MKKPTILSANSLYSSRLIGLSEFDCMVSCAASLTTSGCMAELSPIGIIVVGLTTTTASAGTSSAIFCSLLSAIGTTCASIVSSSVAVDGMDYASS